MDNMKQKEKELAAYAGGTDRAVLVDRFRFTEGKASGMDGISVKTLNGLYVSLLPDRGLDIARVDFKGITVSYLSKNGLVSPAYADMQKDGFTRYYTGGMLTTCGLRHVGGSCIDDNGEYHPTHGNYSLLQAKDISVIRPDPSTVIISGIVRETALFGHDLELKRSIRISDTDLSIETTDVLTNLSSEEEEIMVLYHYNFGYPFLQDGCRIVFQEGDEVIPRTDEARSGLDKHKEICAPVDGYSEQVFLHIQKGGSDGFAKVKVINDALGITAQLEYDTKVLPVLAQWKSMKSGDYALGIEPSNNFIKGRKEERAAGSLKKIGSFEEIKYRTCLRFT